MSERRKKIPKEDIALHKKIKILCMKICGTEVRLTQDHIEMIKAVLREEFGSAQCILLIGTITFSHSSEIEGILEVDFSQVGGSPGRYFIECDVMKKIIEI